MALFAKDDLVEVLAKNHSRRKWFTGRIKAAYRPNADGHRSQTYVYDIVYDCGGNEKRCPAQYIQRASFQEEDRVEARYANGQNWYVGWIDRTTAMTPSTSGTKMTGWKRREWRSTAYAAARSMSAR